MTNEIIKVTTNEKGQEVVSARELYLGLGLNKAVWKRWYESNIINNDFFKENVDWVGFNIMLNGNKSQDFAITLEFAKHIAMMARTEKSHQYRNYFLECEKKAKESKPQLTQEQYNVLTLYEMGGQKAVAIAMEIKQSGIEVGLNIGKGQGMKRLCENGVVTIPIIMDYIKEHYPNEFAYTCDIPTTEWTRYLRHMGYLKTQHFARKDGKGMEAKWSYQPTEMFNEVFVEQGMAIVREIDKDRGKVEISYTIEIEKYLLTDNFKNTFFGYLDKIYPKIDEVVA